MNLPRQALSTDLSLKTIKLITWMFIQNFLYGGNLVRVIIFMTDNVGKIRKNLK
jgi:hypothetical protein